MEQRPEPRRDDPIRPNKVNNPRDNLVAMVAITTGEEGFDDKNNNGQFDAPGEFDPRYDLTEPFVDNNDDGTWQETERFVDTNGNGKWDGKNGLHDASTLIWVQERILWTGWPHPLDRDETALNRTPIVRQLKPPVGTTVILEHFGQAEAVFLLTDPWFNHVAQNQDGDGCSGGNIGPIIVDNLSQGIAFTYPAFSIERFVMRDQHDPAAVPPAPRFPDPGISFEVTAVCRYTAAQEEGHVVLLNAPTILGKVF
jgi:hypothetical protein